MKTYILVLLFLATINVSAGIVATGDTWAPVGNTELRVFRGDKDSGVGEDAIFVDGRDTFGEHGITYTFQGSMMQDESYSVQTSVYNSNSSYVKYRVDLYNLTDKKLLASSPLIVIAGNDRQSKNTLLNYTAQPADVGDVLQLRYIRDDDGNKARDFVIDKAELNDSSIAKFTQLFLPRPIIDISPNEPSAAQISEMDQILNDMSDLMLGTVAPTKTELSDAITHYNALQIMTSGNFIRGKLPAPITSRSWEQAVFLKVFAQHLKLYPDDKMLQSNGLTIAEMAINTVWFFSQQSYAQILKTDHINYFYKLFATPAVFLKPYLSEDLQHLFFYTLYHHSKRMMFYWSPTYEITGQSITGAINTDDISNISDVQLVFGLMQDTPQKKLQWTSAFKRYYERFLRYTPATCDGIKPDGSGFHHASALNNYTYAYDTPMKIMTVLDKTSFQISEQAYKVLRKGVYTQLFLANDNMEPLSMCGRHPEARKIAPNRDWIRSFAITGGSLLGLSGPDPVIASAYVRHWGTHNDLPDVKTEKLNGFAQLNYHTSAIYWKDNWMASARGQTNWSLGSEMNFPRQSYGRYQSYGTLEIIYPGGEEAGNGYRYNGWDWNYNPGTTSIVLPWKLLRVENKHQREFQKKGFVGSLALDLQNHQVYTNTFGRTGMFAMDFAETEENTGQEPLGPNTHNSSFVFKKSVFFFDDYILTLGSGINNDDEVHPTITTLYQRLSEENADVVVNNKHYSSLEKTIFKASSDHWLVDNYATGFYVVGESGDVKIQRKNQQAPYFDQPDYNQAKSNPPVDYSIGYIDHGTNPVDRGYEFIVKPGVSTIDMAAFAEKMFTDRPYQVYQKDENAHIVRDLKKGISAYALFKANSSLPQDLIVRSNDTPCLIMYQEIDLNRIKLSLSNPDLGLEMESFISSGAVSIQITLNGYWKLDNPHPDIKLIGSEEFSTVYQFKTSDGFPIEIELTKTSSGRK